MAAAVQVVTVLVEDREPPVLRLYGEAVMKAEVGCAFVDPFVGAWDQVDGVLTRNVTVRVGSRGSWANVSRVNTSLPAGSRLILEYRVQDRAGLNANITRAVDLVDTRPPTLNLSSGPPSSPPRPWSLDAANPHPDYNVANFAFLSPTVRDNSVGKVNVSALVRLHAAGVLLAPPAGCPGRNHSLMVDNVDPQAPNGTVYNITYEAKDPSNNMANVTEYIVVVDRQAPDLITPLPRSSLTLEYTPDSVNWAAERPSLGGAMPPGCSSLGPHLPDAQTQLRLVVKCVEAVDLVDGNVSCSLTLNVTVGYPDGSSATAAFPQATYPPGTRVTLLFEAADSAGNRNSTAIELVIVDKTPPIINLSNAPAVVVLRPGKLNENTAALLAGVQVTDTFDVAPELTVLTNVTELTLPGPANITYRGRDRAENVVEANRLVELKIEAAGASRASGSAGVAAGVAGGIGLLLMVVFSLLLVTRMRSQEAKHRAAMREMQRIDQTHANHVLTRRERTRSFLTAEPNPLLDPGAARNEPATAGKTATLRVPPKAGGRFAQLGEAHMSSLSAADEYLEVEDEAIEETDVDTADRTRAPPWLHGMISRQQAEAALLRAAGGEGGWFLVRERKEDESWAMSVSIAGGGVEHHLISRSPGDGQFLFNNQPCEDATALSVKGTTGNGKGERVEDETEEFCMRCEDDGARNVPVELLAVPVFFASFLLSSSLFFLYFFFFLFPSPPPPSCVVFSPNFLTLFCSFCFLFCFCLLFSFFLFFGPGHC